ncbi:MAG: hypothetical protein IIB83_05005 [Bacteroidetes bacterium]|nr:hypothetical protein [Bacteroidota bacterium]
MKTDKKIKKKIVNKIIRTAYGDASFVEQSEIFIRMFLNTKIKNIYSEYRFTAKEIHSIKLENIELNNLPNKNKERTNNFNKIISFILLRPIGISYASIVLVLGVIVMFILFDKNNEIHYTKAEILQAEQDVKYSLAIIGKVFNETEKKLKEDIINNKIRKPIKKGFEIINTLYK